MKLPPDRMELARRFGVSRRTIERWHQQGIAPDATYIGNKTFYTEEAIARWLEAGGTKPRKAA